MTLRIEIDGTQTEVAPGTTVLAAVRALGGTVPTLCFDERQEPFGACRVCLVGVDGAPGPVAACTAPCRDGMKVDTRDPTARRVAAA
ncbi:MAG: 2Fe-2S iron-sulfur cluster-binding protein, partial [Solirubrobacteraceae bacterium]